MSPPARRLVVLPVEGLGEVRTGEDLAELITAASSLTDGDILVVTSKVVSKAEGRLTSADREAVVADETDRVVARRGGTVIVRTRQGLVLAAAGVDASNTAPGTVVMLPADPDGSARALRDAIGSGEGPNVAVVLSDTLGRAWRNGQTDAAVGAAGLTVLGDLAGEPDGYGNRLAVTQPAFADEVASAADLVKGKLDRSPAAVLRGLGHLVAARGEHGPGARALVRPEQHDMFGHGAREAVLRALAGQGADLRGFGGPAAVEDLEVALREVSPGAEVLRVPDPRAGGNGATVAVEVLVTADADSPGQRLLGGEEARLRAAAFAHGWLPENPREPEQPTQVRLRFAPGTP